MIIKFTNYKDGVHLIEFEKTVKELELTDLLDENSFIKINCKMDKSPGQIVLYTDFSFMSIFNCDRCNDEYQQNLSNEFILTYLFSNESVENEDLNLYYLPKEIDKINIREDVIEYIRLSIPMKKLCSENCRGICPMCGTNLNHSTCSCTFEAENPIWDKLKELKNKLEN